VERLSGKSNVTQAREDLRLIEAIKGGNETAFAELVRKYQRQVANVIYLTLGSPDDVEDLTQEVFIRVHRSLPRFEYEASLFAWIYRIAVNISIDELRRRKIKKTLSIDYFSEAVLHREEKTRKSEGPSDHVLLEEKRVTIREAIDKLSPAHRVAIVLREYEGLSYGENCETLNISPQAVKSRIFRAREELRKLLSNYFEERT